MKPNSNTIKLSTYSIYADPIIGHHLSPRRDRCPGSLLVRQGVADALAGRCFSPLHTSKENLYFFKFYRLGYDVALGYRNPDIESEYRRGYEDFLSGLEMIESSKAYIDGFNQAESDEIDRRRCAEEIYWNDREYAW